MPKKSLYVFTSHSLCFAFASTVPVLSIPGIIMSASNQLLHKVLRACLVMCGVIVFVGSIYNSSSSKYSRSRNTDCNRGILALYTSDSHICCDSSEHQHTWLCTASFDPLNSWFSSYWALVIPLLPLILNALCSGARPSQSLQRALIYITIFALRTVSFHFRSSVRIMRTMI
jgi:hypothetical protein